MITVYSDAHLQHTGLKEMDGNGWREAVESPERASNVIRVIRERLLGEVIKPKSFADNKLLRIHDADYLQFLQSAWNEWVAQGNTADNARPFAFVGAGMRHADGRSIHSRLGRYSFDADSPIVAGSWNAIRSSAEVALTAAELIISGEDRAFAACRPPGHHATANYCGGYCYLNNAALAAQSLRDSGMRRIAIVDVDYHHGNGTQTLFYRRSDILTVSLHADPADEYPYFLGFSDELGEGDGEGKNLNFPMPFSTDWKTYSGALQQGLTQVSAFAPDAIVVPLGLDTFTDDPIANFALQQDDYLRMGEMISALQVPVLAVLEGGYSVDHIGDNCANFLEGLEMGGV